MPIPDNLKSIHLEEERIRAASVDSIEQSPALNDHIAAIHSSMALLMALNQGHEAVNQEERVLQYLGLRIFNSCASSLKLGLSGYYQNAFASVRDIFETVQLLDYFSTHPEKILVWESADKKSRINEFGPASIRKALDKRDGFTEQKRKHQYEQLSEYASHTTAVGFSLVAPDGLGKMGPFENTKYLQALIEELVKYAVHGAVIFSKHIQTKNLNLMQEKLTFLQSINSWRNRYFGPESSSPDATGDSSTLS